MPEIGEIKKGREIGRGGSQAYQNFIRVACEICGTERWTASRKGKSLFKRCYVCTRKTGKLTRRSDSRGYIDILLTPDDDFFHSMANKDGRVAEHRLVMAKHLGRCLQPWEIVHHKDHIRDNNELENLQLISEMGHKQLTQLEAFINKLQKQITILQTKNAQLRREKR